MAWFFIYVLKHHVRLKSIKILSFIGFNCYHVPQHTSTIRDSGR